MCHDHRQRERGPEREAIDAAEAERAEREAELDRALTGEDGRVFVPPADD